MPYRIVKNRWAFFVYYDDFISLHLYIFPISLLLIQVLHDPHMDCIRQLILVLPAV